MSISQRIDQRQTQTLVMTPQLQQAIKLLQMSNMELGDFVEQEIEKNPLLERSESTAPEATISGEADLSAPPAPAADPAPLSGSDSENLAESSDDTWASDGYTSEDRFASAGTGGSFDDDEFSSMQNIEEKPSLRAHLLGQIHVDFTDPADQMIAAALVEMLDEAGYLPADLDLMRSQLGVSPEHFENIIARLQRFDPCGIFARSLHECLALQLHEKDRLDPAMGILLQHLDLLARRENAALMRLCAVDAEDLAQMIAEIRQLNPKPAASFISDVAPPDRAGRHAAPSSRRWLAR